MRLSSGGPPQAEEIPKFIGFLAKLRLHGIIIGAIAWKNLRWANMSLSNCITS